MKIIKDLQEINIEKWQWEPGLPKDSEAGLMGIAYLVPIIVEELEGYQLADEKPNIKTTGYCIVEEAEPCKWIPIHKYLMDYKKARELLKWSENRLFCRTENRLLGEMFRKNKGVTSGGVMIFDSQDEQERWLKQN